MKSWSVGVTLLVLLSRAWAQGQCNGNDVPSLVIQGSAPTQPISMVVSNGGKWIVLDHPLTLLDGRHALQWGQIGDERQAPLLLTPDGSWLFVTRRSEGVGETNRVQMLAIPSGQLLRTFAVASAPLWTDGKRLRGVKNGRLVEFDLSTGKQSFVRTLPHAPVAPGSTAQWNFSPNGAWLSGGNAGTLRFWRFWDGKLLGELKVGRRAIGRAAISSDGQWLASEGDDPNWVPPTEASTEAAYARTFKIHLWNAHTKKLARTFEGFPSLDGGALLLQFSPDGTTLFGAGFEDGLKRFNLLNGHSAPFPPLLKDDRQQVTWPVAVSNDGHWLGGAGIVHQSNTFAPGAQLWDMARHERQSTFAGTLRGADGVKWSPGGNFLAGGDRLTIWNAKTGQLLAEKPTSYCAVFGLAFQHPDPNHQFGRHQ